jgi:putative component of toxin-antitoxin plasmid stabilization module
MPKSSSAMADTTTKQFKRLRKLRRVNLGAANTPERVAEQRENSMVRYIFKHPKYEHILAALREGNTVKEIARYYAEAEFIEVNESTFASYLAVFKRKYPQLLDPNKTGDDGLDDLVHAHRPNVDVEKELNRLYRLQKLRLNIDVRTEKNMGKLFKDLVKDIEASHKILETIAKVQGRIKTTGNMNEAEGLTEGVRDEIRRMRNTEGHGDRMFTLTNELVGSLRNAVNKVTA